MKLSLKKITQNAALQTGIFSMLKSEPARASNWTGGLIRQVVHVFFGILLAVSAHAATYYVDSSVSSSGNGQSWVTAWKNLSNITGLAAGDMVYISGGPSGSSQTYAISSWAPAGGTSGNPITYKIGQDSSHNGTAYFSGSGGVWITSAINNVVISGDAGDGKRHFTLADPVSNISSWSAAVIINGANCLNFHLSYVNFGVMNGNYDSTGLCIVGLAPSGATMSGVEFDHLWMEGTNSQFNITIHLAGWPTTGLSWSQGFFLHDSTILCPYPNYGAVGADAVQAATAGLTVSNCIICGYSSIYQGSGYFNGQHMDGVQVLGGDYNIFCNNLILNMQDCGIFEDCWVSINHVRIYNNTIINDTAASCIWVFHDSYNTTTALSYNDVVIANNVVEPDPGFYGISVRNTFGTADTFSGVIANNISINYPNGVTVSGVSGVSTVDNAVLTTSAAAANFVGYVYGSTNSNFHLSASATSLIGQGTNLSTYFNTDKGGNTRPSSGAWDIGAYQYSTNTIISTNLTVPTVSAISVNASDINQSQAGLQIYSGTVVSFSATATNAMTYQWSYTVNGGSSVVLQSGSGAVPAVNFSFGTNTIGNTYVFTISVSNTQGSAQSQLTLNVVPPPVASSSLTFAAQSGSISSPFVLGTNGTTIYVYQPIQTVGINSNGIATYNFMITNAGNYEVQALVNAPNDAANSLYVNVDGVPQDPDMAWDVLITSGFEERLVSWRGNGTDTANQFVPWIFPLTNGVHQILFYGREANTQLAGFSILQAPPTPPPPSIQVQ
jgi:hypothetical protein